MLITEEAGVRKLKSLHRKEIIVNPTPITWANSVCRVFIDTAISGCGNGCKYCYVASAQNQQALYESETFRSYMDQLRNSTNFRAGRCGTLISLCPHTEPFKTFESICLVKIALATFLPLSNPIQISTKESVPHEILEFIKINQKYNGQVVIFVSITTFTKADIVEPNAEIPLKRIENIGQCKLFNVACCLYVKPFIGHTLIDLPIFIDMISTNNPLAVCVGITYSNNTHLANYRHPANLSISSLGPNEDLFYFASEIRSCCNILTFYTSSCVSAYFRNWRTSSLIWIRHHELCIQCRDCNTEYLAIGK